MSKDMTGDEYIQEYGLKCPYCRSKDIDSDVVTPFNGRATAFNLCNECGREWLDRYKLTGYQEVEQ